MTACQPITRIRGSQYRRHPFGPARIRINLFHSASSASAAYIA
jgi:hypothetical protein